MREIYRLLNRSDHRIWLLALLLGFFLSPSLLVHGNTILPDMEDDKIVVVTDDSSWELIHSESGINVYVKTDVCDLNGYFIFKLENLNTTDYTVDYTVDDPDAVTHGLVELSQFVAGGQSVEGDCTMSSMKLICDDVNTAPTSLSITLTLN